jgi:diguanylate cyclase (GGDEF)-like protein
VVRKIDIVCRWGGEEFLLLLPETDLEGGAILAEKIKDLISITPYQFKDIDLQFSMTFGVSIFDGSKNVDDVIKEADEALYYGKTHGKNQVVKHGMY